MECEVKVTRTSGDGRYHSSSLSVADNGDSVDLVCSTTQCFFPIKLTVNEHTITRIIDVRIDAGFTTIKLSEYHTNGIQELSIKNANPTKLKDLVKRMKAQLPSTTSVKSPFNKPSRLMSRGSKMLAASKAITSGHSIKAVSLTTPPRYTTPPKPAVLSVNDINSLIRLPLRDRKRSSSSAFEEQSFLTPSKRRIHSDNTATSPPGFINLGNSCYMNAVLQSLLALKHFVTDLKATVADATAPDKRFIHQLLLLEQCPSRPALSRIRALLCRHGQSLTIFNEQDAQEVLILCLDIIRKESGLQQCPVSSNFEVSIEQRLVCTKCGDSSIITDKMADLTLHITNVHLNVQQILCQYFKPERVEYRCGQCCHGYSTLSRAISVLPRVLVLTLKRYSSDHCKTMDPIVISPSIDLESLVVKATAGDSCVSSDENVSANIQHECPTTPITTNGPYTLHSVISHLGDESAYGHYIADVYSSRKKEWLTYSDSVVTETTIEDIVENRRLNAYILFYVQSDEL